MALLAESPGGGGSAIWCTDLLTGEAAPVFTSQAEISLTGWAFSPQSNLLHIIEPVGDHAEIVQIAIPDGEPHRIVPSVPVPAIGFAECTADDRYIFAHVSLKEIPEGTSETEALAMRGAEPGRNLMYRINLENGVTELVFEADDWWMGHCNPNPVHMNLFMCCQEGFVWTERYPCPANFQRQRVYDFAMAKWLDLEGAMKSRGTHEHWSFHGRRIYSHGWRYGGHAIYVSDLEQRTSTRYLGPPDYGLSMHIAPAPDESFLIGDGHNFCRMDAAALPDHHRPGSGDNPWSWDGILNASPGETIWLYQLPANSLWSDDVHFATDEEARRAVEADPEGAVTTRPLCTFRSRAKLLRETIRLESNAHVTPDNQWGVFQSCSEDGLYEVWAARIP